MSLAIAAERKRPGFGAGPEPEPLPVQAGPAWSCKAGGEASAPGPGAVAHSDGHTPPTSTYAFCTPKSPARISNVTLKPNCAAADVIWPRIVG